MVKDLKGELEVLKDSSQKDKAKSVDMEQTMNSEIAQLTSSLMEMNLVCNSFCLHQYFTFILQGNRYAS